VITVDPAANQPPDAVDDGPFNTDQDTVLDDPLLGVLDNDSDPDAGDTIMISSFVGTSAQGASVLVRADGTFRYDPTAAPALIALGAGQMLLDTFTYTIADSGGLMDTATVSILVTGVNDGPTAVDDVGDTTSEDTVFLHIQPSIFQNDTDPDDGDELSLVAFDATSAMGAAVTVFDDGSFRYDPTVSATLQALSAGQTVMDTFTYTITDDAGLTDTATVTMTVTGVNDAPDAVDDGPFTTDEDTILSMGAPGLLSNDSDVDAGDTITVTAFDATSAQGATVVVNADGSFSYDPTGSATLQALNAGQTATDTFTYTISDDAGLTDTATVSINVTGVDEVVPLAVADTQVNGGDAQRSSINSLTVEFNQGVNVQALIDNGQITTAAQVFNTTAGTPVTLAAGNYSYNAATATLTLDLSSTPLADGRYELRLTGAITQDGNASNTLPPQQVGFYKLLGDFDGDATVDDADRSLFLQHYGTSVGGANYDPDFDLNDDGLINIQDYAIWTQQFGTSV
jgi:VCBS repeat-containing protein